jgi:hypothetical protein
MQKEKTELSFPLPFLYYLKQLLLVFSMLLLCIWPKKWSIQFKQYTILIEKKCEVQAAKDSYTNTLRVVNINDIEKNMSYKKNVPLFSTNVSNPLLRSAPT